MASMAKSAQKTLVSYAGVVSGKGVKSSFFATTVCDIKLPRNVPNKRIPNTNEKYSFFVDLANVKATEEEVADTLASFEGIIGAKYRADLAVVEFVCINEEAQKKALNTEFFVNKDNFVAIAPRHLLQRTILVKIANMDFGIEADLKEKLVTYWSQYGEVIDAAPHKFPGKPWLTQRWDILLTLPENKKKPTAPVVFKLEGSERTLLATWPGAAKSCLKCLAAGHATSNCRGKIPKAGERPNPEQKDLQVAPAKNGQKKSVPEKKPGMDLERVPLPEPKQTVNTGAQSASVSASASTSATVSESVSVSVSASVRKSPDSGEERPELQTLLEEEQAKAGKKEMTTRPGINMVEYVLRGKPGHISNKDWEAIIEGLPEEEKAEVKARVAIILREGYRTPPPLPLKDPDTPRKGDKRMAKEDETEAEGFKKFAADSEEGGSRRSGRRRKPIKK